MLEDCGKLKGFFHTLYRFSRALVYILVSGQFFGLLLGNVTQTITP